MIGDAKLGAWRFRGDRPLLGRSTPPVARTLGQLLDELADRYSETEAIVFNNIRLTYGQLRTRVERVSAGLAARGVNKGDHVAILMGNRPEWIIFWLALNRIGAVAVGISTWSSPSELRYILRHSDTRMLIFTDRVGARELGEIVNICLGEVKWSNAEPFAPLLPCLRQVLRVNDKSAEFSSLAEIEADGMRIPSGLIEELAKEVRPADVALLLYTSGSTSTPKGVQLVHRILIENGFDIGEGERLSHADRFWLSLPLFWSAGSANSAMAILTHGATIVLQEYFEVAEAVRLLQSERCTHYFAFPNVTQAIHTAMGNSPRLPCARVAVTSGQPEILAMLHQMGFSVLLHPYGTTEDYGFATINGDDETTETLAWSQGRPLPGMELMVRDPATSLEANSGQPGEICLRGNVTIGYYKDEDKNRAAFDDAGFFHTGDIAIRHPDGRLQFLGRSSEMIKTSGFNVSPAEIEVALLSVPGVAEAYVVGIPDTERGQAVIACVRTSEASLSRDCLHAHCKQALSAYKVPRDFVLLDAFPLTATGKVSKKALAEIAERLYQPAVAARS
jgi:fatty-acyl-CoA synthase